MLGFEESVECTSRSNNPLSTKLLKFCVSAATNDTIEEQGSDEQTSVSETLERKEEETPYASRDLRILNRSPVH